MECLVLTPTIGIGSYIVARWKGINVLNSLIVSGTALQALGLIGISAGGDIQGYFTTVIIGTNLIGFGIAEDAVQAIGESRRLLAIANAVLGPNRSRFNPYSTDDSDGV